MSPAGWLRLVIIVSVLLRLAVAVYMGDQVVDLPGTSDQLSYHTLAGRVLEGYGFTFPNEWWPVTKAGAPTAHWSFLYTFYLIVVYAVFGVHPIAARLIQAVIVGILHPWLAYQIGRSVFGPGVGLASAAITAVYVYFIYYAGALMTEPFYITAILAVVYVSMLLVRRNPEKTAEEGKRRLYALASLLGVSLAAAVLLRQLFLLLVPFILLWVIWVGGRSRWLPVLLSAATILVAILPITFFNYARFNRFVLLNTNAGYAFYMGNHPIYGTRFIPILPSDMYIRIIPWQLRSLDEAALDQELLKLGIGFVKADPVRYLLLSASRIPAYFMFWPSGDSGLVSNLSRVGSFGLFLPLMIYGLVRTLIDRRKKLVETIADPTFLLLLLMLVYSVIHVLTWALIRYRLPVDAMLVIFAGYALVHLYHRFFLVRRTAQPSTTPPNLHSL